MKNTGKIIFLTLLAAAALSACREDETLDLAGYPDASMGLGIEGQENGVNTVRLTAVYDGEGQLSVDGELERTYTFALASPAPEDLTFRVEPLAVNIPTDKVEISATELKIPAGQRAAEPVTVRFFDEELTFAQFAQPDPEAKTYELGVRVVGTEGYPTGFAGGNEAKVVVTKETYTSHYSVLSTEGNPVEFTRSYAKGNIVEEEPISVPGIQIVLDRPALEDLVFDLSSAGIPEAFAQNVSITPARLTIPAGEKVSSETAVWAVTDDFLKATAEAAEYLVELTPVLTGENPNAAPAEEDTVLTIEIYKELYTSNVSVSASRSRSVTLKRTYIDGVIVNQNPMSFEFTIELDRPAYQEVKFAVTTEGLPEAFAGDATITPSELAIAKGETTVTGTWTMKDDFLLTTDQKESYDFTLNVAPTVEDELITPVENGMQIAIHVDKTFDLLSFVSSLDASWTMYDRTGWGGECLTTGAAGRVTNLFDGNERSDLYTTYGSDELEFTVDMLEAKRIDCIVVKAYWSSHYYQPAKIVISTSDDGQTWTRNGELDSERSGIHRMQFIRPVTARYIKYEGSGSLGYGIDLVEFEVWAAAE